MAARKNRGSGKGSMPQEWKDKIKASQIANRFYECFNGNVDLTTEQIRCGEALFKRMEPELSRVDSTISNPDGSPVFAEIAVTVVRPDGDPKSTDT